MKKIVTKHTEIRLTKKDCEAFIMAKVYEYHRDLDKAELVWNIDEDGVFTGASIYSRKEDE